MRVVLLGNYIPDQQESMQRFASVLRDQLQQRRLEVELIRPTPICGGFGDPYGGWGKWCGYIDKFILFPRALRKRVRAWTSQPEAATVIHVCDQANALYLPILKAVPHVVTCCDLLAVRSALGELPRHRTRWTGRRLQRTILRGLNHAKRVTCISQATLQDVLRLTTLRPEQTDVTSMGLNYPYRPMPMPEAQQHMERLAQRNAAVPPPKFLLHVGGNQWYKNRLGLLRIYSRLRQLWPSVPPLILAGKPLSKALRTFIRQEQLDACVFSWTHCDNEDLRCLYSLAEHFIFPSLEEGFGWPIIEAQACGCPVITSRRAPMTEVGGDAAVYLDPEQTDHAATVVWETTKLPASQRQERVQSGLRNAARYTTEAMVEKYLQLYTLS